MILQTRPLSGLSDDEFAVLEAPGIARRAIWQISRFHNHKGRLFAVVGANSHAMAIWLLGRFGLSRVNAGEEVVFGLPRASIRRVWEENRDRPVDLKNNTFRGHLLVPKPDDFIGGWIDRGAGGVLRFAIDSPRRLATGAHVEKVWRTRD